MEMPLGVGLKTLKPPSRSINDDSDDPSRRPPWGSSNSEKEADSLLRTDAAALKATEVAPPNVRSSAAVYQLMEQGRTSAYNHRSVIINASM